MFTNTPNAVTKPWPRPLGIQPPPSPAIPFPARWDQRGLEECTSASINTPVKFANGT